MDAFISYSELTDFYCLPADLVNKGLYRYRQGTGKSWANHKDNKDGRKIWIERDSIPVKTREKYNIPSCEDLKVLELKREALLKEDETKRIMMRLESAINQDYENFLLIYEDKYADSKKRTQLAKKHALYTAILSLCGKTKPIYGMAKKVFDVFQTFDYSINKPSYDNFTRTLKKIRKNGLEAVLIHKNLGNKHPIKVTDYHLSMIVIYASHSNIYPISLVTEMVNFECERKELPKICTRTVRNYVNNPDMNTVLERYRYGEASFLQNVMPFVPRERETYAGNLWVMDGTPAQFYCWNGKTGKERRRIRLNLYVVIDAFSRKVVGYDISLSEDRFNVLNSLKMAFKIHGHLPARLLHDNFSANKTDEVQEVKDKLERLGVVFRASKPGNPKDKTYVERFFGTLQSTIMRLYDDYIGEGITSKRKNGRPDPEFVRKNVQKTDLSIEELKHRLSKMIVQYNNLSIDNRATPNSLYKVSPKPKVRQIEGYKIPFLFWYKTTVTVRRSMVQITVQKIKYFFKIQNHRDKMMLNNTKVDVRFDENDLSEVHLFKEDTDIFICTSKQYNKAKEENTNDEILRQSAHNKSYDDFLVKEHQRIIMKGLKSVGIESFTPTDPLSLDKYQVNDTESSELHDYYCIENGLDSNMIDDMKGQTKRKTYTTTHDDLITIKSKVKPDFKIIPNKNDE